MHFNPFALPASLRDDLYPTEPANDPLLVPTWHLENRIVYFAKLTFTLRGQNSHSRNVSFFSEMDIKSNGLHS